MIDGIHSFYSRSEEYKIPFPHPGGWSLDLEACKFLCALIHHCKLSCILEFGSGFSSSIMAYELEKHHVGTIDSIDNSNYWSAQAANLSLKYNLGHRIQFHVLKLTLKKKKYYGHIFYDINNNFFSKELKYDLVVVDAPHHDLGRDGAIYQTIDKLPVGSYFFVHDTNSDHMKATIQRWQEHYPTSISVMKFNDIGNGVSLIRKEQYSDHEPVFSIRHFTIGWIRTIRNYKRLKYLSDTSSCLANYNKIIRIDG